ncbi:WD repeat-containing protein DWA2 [Camellia lanceoleosa]|uniref:WD repeat-containing protein DWA2 n=1 Tax=Camellia lanceoleosa TaxID=1840588 RepID=A0ACC0GX19_9ERIC|nr:WD repeat-containing protein DWA2 [Camellia lanceoleosa]
MIQIHDIQQVSLRCYNGELSPSEFQQRRTEHFGSSAASGVSVNFCYFMNLRNLLQSCSVGGDCLLKVKNSWQNGSEKTESSSFGTELKIVFRGEPYGAAIWQIPELYGQLNSPQLECIGFLDAHNSKIKCTLWWPSGRHEKLISIDEQNLYLWSLDSSRKTAQVQSQESAGMLYYLSGGAWDPHDVNSVASISKSSIQFWDLRTMKKENSIEHAHVHNVDYDTKRKYILVTAEDESGIHVWDLRMPEVPILELPGHAHWTWAVRCNPEYDGLILSAGTDSTVNVWLTSPPNSDDITYESLVKSRTRLADPLLNSYSDYEDSVYGLAWSSREPWIFASLSYDGRVVVETIKPHLLKDSVKPCDWWGTGFLYWGANCYEKATVGSAEIRFRRGLPPGDGVLFYPGEVFSSSHNPVASLRLE